MIHLLTWYVQFKVLNCQRVFIASLPRKGGRPTELILSSQSESCKNRYESLRSPRSLNISWSSHLHILAFYDFSGSFWIFLDLSLRQVLWQKTPWTAWQWRQFGPVAQGKNLQSPRVKVSRTAKNTAPPWRVDHLTVGMEWNGMEQNLW